MTPQTSVPPRGILPTAFALAVTPPPSDCPRYSPGPEVAGDDTGLPRYSGPSLTLVWRADAAPALPEGDTPCPFLPTPSTGP